MHLLDLRAVCVAPCIERCWQSFQPFRIWMALRGTSPCPNIFSALFGIQSSNYLPECKSIVLPCAFQLNTLRLPRTALLICFSFCLCVCYSTDRALLSSFFFNGEFAKSVLAFSTVSDSTLLHDYVVVLFLNH